MAITEHQLERAFKELNSTCGGHRNDYFGLLYLEQEFGLAREHAISQVAFGGNDYGIDGFHFDRDRRNLYIFQFKWSTAHAQFRKSLERMIADGVERVFGAKSQDQTQNQIVMQLKSCIMDNQAIIDRVCVHFVFTGDPAEAERSQVLDKLREDLENKKYLVDERFGRSVTLVVEFRSGHTRKVGGATHVRTTHSYPVQLENTSERSGPDGERMTLGFIRLTDLALMYREMGQRFFERNIRSSLPSHKNVNRAIERAFKDALISGSVDPRAFAFNHNGVTLFAEAIRANGELHDITEPRLLNGAQSVTAFTRFLEANTHNRTLKESTGKLEDLRVLCRVITGGNAEFVTRVTINNNRQNPVNPWNLHANDMIQLLLQDKFRDDLGIYYERQEKAFDNLSDEDLEGMRITSQKAIELVRLAKTYLAVEGEVDKLGHLKEVFEDDRLYERTFSEGRLKEDSAKILACYKAQFRLGKMRKEIIGCGPQKYAFVQNKGTELLLWGLVCQGILNDPQLPKKLELFGQSLTMEAQFTDWVTSIATKHCRPILADLITDKAYQAKVQEENYSFLRTNAAYERSMELARKKFRWSKRNLK